MDETFEGLEDDDVEELADKEVEKVLWEVTSGQLGELSGTPTATPQDQGVSASPACRPCTVLLCPDPCRLWVRSPRWTRRRRRT